MPTLPAPPTGPAPVALPPASQRPPRHTNGQGGIVDALAFITSGETAVTSSFHSPYWAMPMGCRVLCPPFSGRFSGFAHMPDLADTGTWQGDFSHA